MKQPPHTCSTTLLLLLESSSWMSSPSYFTKLHQHWSTYLFLHPHSLTPKYLTSHSFLCPSLPSLLVSSNSGETQRRSTASSGVWRRRTTEETVMLCVNVFSNIGELSFRIPPLFLKILVENERGNEIGFGWLGFCVFLLRYNEDASSDFWFDFLDWVSKIVDEAWTCSACWIFKFCYFTDLNLFFLSLAESNTWLGIEKLIHSGS